MNKVFVFSVLKNLLISDSAINLVIINMDNYHLLNSRWCQTPCWYFPVLIGQGGESQFPDKETEARRAE